MNKLLKSSIEYFIFLSFEPSIIIPDYLGLKKKY